jgi:hypothetical protein
LILRKFAGVARGGSLYAGDVKRPITLRCEGLVEIDGLLFSQTRLTLQIPEPA